MAIQVSPEDSELSLLYWRLSKGYPRHTFYAPRRYVFLHRIIMSRITGRPLTQEDIVDHINHDKEDNRRSNLRLVTIFGSNQNIKSHPYRGTATARNGRWRSVVQFHGQQYYLGTFTDRQEAARVAARKRKELGFLEDHICPPSKPA